MWRSGTLWKQRRKMQDGEVRRRRHERRRVNTRQAARSEQDFEEKPDVAEDANDEKGGANDRRARSKRRRPNERKLKLACNKEKPTGAKTRNAITKNRSPD
ncbi:hypothetical protein R1flu_000688 [Riccia fluitans]|uniref:Uncharacterized protein n=1 Tax=Riccia fluitans TaxID=41844 RepID=A0ABD1Y169_9MARC